MKSLFKKEVKFFKEKFEREKILLEDKLFVKYKYKGDCMYKIGDEIEFYFFEKGLKVEENI